MAELHTPQNLAEVGQLVPLHWPGAFQLLIDEGHVVVHLAKRGQKKGVIRRCLVDKKVKQKEKLYLLALFVQEKFVD